MTPERGHLVAAGVKEPEKWLDAVVLTCAEFGIDTPQRIAAFLAQSAHESAGYTALEENLNYRALTLATCWPKRFSELEPGVPVAKAKSLKNEKGQNIPNKFAQVLEKHPEQIANVVYGARMGNGPIESGEGWKFRGRGLKQLTGKDNYTRCGRALGLDLVEQPDLLLDVNAAARSAGWFWDSNHCASYIDHDDFRGLTIRINGGLLGLEDRYKRYQAVFSAMGN